MVTDQPGIMLIPEMWTSRSLIGIPDITSTTFDIDETGANGGFQLAVVDDLPDQCGVDA